MADYIYLLQNRLTPAQWRAVEAVREAARNQSMPVFLVGGAVRDLTSGSPVRDLDLAVQGDAERLVEALEAAGATVTGRNSVLSSLYLTFRGGIRVEIAPTLSVTYEKPGQPVAHTAAILDDLRRRDFTANAMAVSLNEGSYGLLLDPLNGTADIENREFRLVSAYGFIENPALLVRAARLSNRLGWLLEERTASRYQTSKEEEHLKALLAADRGYELEEIFHEEDPIAAMEHLAAEGWLGQLFGSLKPETADRNAIEGVRDAIGQMESQGIFPDPSAVYFPLLTGKLQEKDRAALKASFARPGFAQQIDSIEQRAKELGSQLASKAAALPSDAWRLLRGAEPDLVLWLAFHVRSGAVQTKIKAFLKDWPQMRQKLPYALMQEMRITPDLPGYDKLLDDLFFALIDGKLDTPEATRAFLEPYSPPAPPQISVRRRPAKAARGRAKKAVAEEALADVPDEVETPDEDLSEANESEDEEPEKDSGEVTESEAPDDSEEDLFAELPAEVAEIKVAEVAEPLKSAEDVAPESVARPKSAAPKKVAAPIVTSKTAAPPSTSKKEIAKGGDSKKHAPEKVSAVTKSSQTRPPIKTAAVPASTAKKSPGKQAAPAKLAVKASAGKVAPGKAVAAKKDAAKKIAVKLPTPAKKIAAKKVAAKTSPAKKAKAQPNAPARGSAAAKGSAKATKKVAPSVRGRR